MTLHETLLGKRTPFHALFLLLFLALLAGIGPHAVAQDEEGTATWADPLNLSQSGAATAPQTVTGAGGTTHVIWQDEIADSFVYVAGTVDNWSEATVVELPFGTRQYVPDLDEEDPTPLFSPQLVADGNGRIHAFWLNEERQGFHSSVAADDFSQFGAWTVPIQLAEAAAGLDVGVDTDGRLHFAYIRTVATDSSPAGVYYRRSSTGTEWSDPTLLYRSAYFRDLAPERANVRVDAGSGGNTGPVYVAWDNRSLERVFIARSTNSGQTWLDAEAIDERQAEDPLEGVGPSNVMVSASGDDVLLLWQAGHGASNCAQYFQWSTDGGSTWEPRQRMLDELATCPTQNQMAKANDGLTFLLTTVAEQPYLLAWNGSGWSNFQPEPILAGFISPETYRRVAFSCLQLDVVDGRFLVVGCGLSEDEDVWLTSRSTGAVVTWFPPPSVWSEPVIVSSSTAPITAPAMTADGSSRIHAVWSQVSEASDGNTALYYARWDGTDWSRPAPVLSSPEGNAEQPAVAMHPAGVIVVTWQDDVGQVYFSRANAERANIATEWFDATPLIRPPTAGSAPDVLVDRAGRVYIAYAVPLNEGRGIYLMTSDDLGETWTEPVLVADAAAAGWPMVDRPHLTATGSEDLHLLWTAYSLPPDATPQGLYYARIGAGDATWSEPRAVAEGVVIWSDVLGVGTRTVHQVWQTVEDDRSVFWHNVSDDGGLTWQRPERLTGLADTPGRAAIAADAAGHVHLVQATAGRVEHQWWDGSWNDGERLPAVQLAGEPAVAIAVSSSAGETAPAGDLRVVYAGQRVASGSGFGVGPRPAREEGEEETAIYDLMAAGQRVEIPAGAATPLPTLTPTPSPMPTETPTPGPSPTPTIVFPAGAETESSGLLPSLPGGTSPWAGLVLGVVSVVLVVGIAFMIGLRVVRSGRN